MKDKTQKSFRGIVRILLLVFCYTFGSHAFALALEHEQTVDIYKVTDVPNPRNESSSNWVSNPNQILDESYWREWRAWSCWSPTARATQSRCSPCLAAWFPP